MFRLAVCGRVGSRAASAVVRNRTASVIDSRTARVRGRTTAAVIPIDVVARTSREMTSSALPAPPMEVEVKLRLSTRQDYERVRAALGERPIKVERQSNRFVDGIHGELAKQRAVLRVRHDSNADAYTLTWKGKAQLVDGISRVEEREAPLDKKDAEEILADPSAGLRALAARSDSGIASALLARQVVETFGCADGWHWIGSFETLREKYPFDSGRYTLELDQTTFPFGTMYEIEIETVDAARAREIIEKVLREHAVDYTYSRFNKFVRMLRGTLSDDVEEGKARV